MPFALGARDFSGSKDQDDERNDMVAHHAEYAKDIYAFTICTLLVHILMFCTHLGKPTCPYLEVQFKIASKCARIATY